MVVLGGSKIGDGGDWWQRLVVVIGGRNWWC